MKDCDLIEHTLGTPALAIRQGRRIINRSAHSAGPGNRQWAMGNGQWAMGSRTVSAGPCQPNRVSGAVSAEPCQQTSGQWAMSNAVRRRGRHVSQAEVDMEMNGWIHLTTRFFGRFLAEDSRNRRATYLPISPKSARALRASLHERGRCEMLSQRRVLRGSRVGVH